jgi:4'-phosphopantetheinyl transferase
MSVLVSITSEFVPSPLLEAQWLGQLPLARRAQLIGRRDGRARLRSLLGSRLLAAGLHRFGYGPKALASLSYVPGSRPTVALPIDFSLSHCDGQVVCALSTHGPVGIDVERLGCLTAGDFHVYLNHEERAWAGQSARRFYSVWTRKEAVAKAAGSRGLLDVIKVEVDTRSLAPKAALAGRQWHVREVPVGPDHVAHLALADKPVDVTFEYLGRAALERNFGLLDIDASVASTCAVL